MKIMARSQSEPGSQASPEALSDLRPAGVDPSRMQWQPIATAPMDGTEVLVALNNWVIAARYCDPQGWYEVNNHWTDSWGGEVYPSHWMPFPLPPAQGIEALQGRDEGSACESPVGRQSDAPIPSPTPEP